MRCINLDGKATKFDEEPSTGVRLEDLPYDKNTVIYYRDTIFLNIINDIFDRCGRPGVIVSQSHPEYPGLDVDRYYYFPQELVGAAQTMQTAKRNDTSVTDFCFNFLINKKQINRYLLLKLVEWFKLTSYEYTWSGTGDVMDLTELIPQFDQLPHKLVGNLAEFKGHILSPVTTIKPQFFKENSLPETTVEKTAHGQAQYGHNHAVYNNILSNFLSRSAVSLISESIAYEKCIHYTEKTIFSVQALTFPIWVGGYKQAEHWRSFGFDTFDDVINHDYQYCDTLLERCYRAFSDNLRLLTDLHWATEQRQQHTQRLLSNREKLLTTLTDLKHRCLEKMSSDVRIFQNQFENPTMSVT